MMKITSRIRWLDVELDDWNY